MSLKAEFAAKQQKYAPNNREGRETNWGNDPFFRRQKDNRPRGKSRQQQMNEEAVMKVRAKMEGERERRASEPPKVVPTDAEVGNAQGDRVVAKKARIADAETQRLRNKFSGDDGIPLVTPAVNYVANRLIDRDMTPNEIRGSLAALTLAPVAAGGFLYANHKSREAEKEKQAQAQAYRDKVAEIIAKRNLLLEQRQSQTQQPTRPRVPYNFFSAAPLVAPANFAFPEIGVRNPFYIKKEKALPLAAVGGTLVAGYGLLSKLNKQRALDAYKVNSLKDKNAQDLAANYFDSPQYHADNLIREAANITGNPLLQSITDNPLDRLTPSQQQAKTKGTARYSRGRGKVANFFDPLITPALALGSTAYGIYNKKKAADEQSEVFEAQKLAALDGIKDKQLRRGLLNKAQNRFIDEDSKNRIIDSALNGDIKSVLRTGLKRANWEALQ
ncbi:hypothetical protein Pam2_15 [Pseudanabaena phage Pam2]|nr:hypothetical protein Pam2_15 [Pseudanabaena phage Pam2]